MRTNCVGVALLQAQQPRTPCMHPTAGQTGRVPSWTSYATSSSSRTRTSWSAARLLPIRRTPLQYLQHSDEDNSILSDCSLTVPGAVLYTPMLRYEPRRGGLSDQTLVTLLTGSSVAFSSPRVEPPRRPECQ
jgi:hypothetical protein